MAPTLFQLAIPLFIAATQVIAQTFSNCNPIEESCPANPALGTTYYQEFNASMTEFDRDLFNISAGSDLITFTDDGAELTLSRSGQSATLETSFYIFFGRVEIVFQAAEGQGIISTVITLSQTLDEIDWEIKGGVTQNVSNNYFGQGDKSQRNSEYPSTESWEGGAMGGFHNYTIDWNEERVEWYMDGELVRPVPYQEAGLWPQTPSAVKFGVWSAGDKDQPEGRVQWAGGSTDWDEGPFTMKIKSLKVVDAQTNVSSYTYGDKSGSFESIEMESGESEAYKVLNELSTSQKAKKQWEGLSTTAKIAIAASVIGVSIVGLIAFAFYFAKQRRAGRAAKAAADQEWDAQGAELMAYRDRMKHNDFTKQHTGYSEKY